MDNETKPAPNGAVNSTSGESAQKQPAAEKTSTPKPATPQKEEGSTPSLSKTVTSDGPSTARPKPAPKPTSTNVSASSTGAASSSGSTGSKPVASKPAANKPAPKAAVPRPTASSSKPESPAQPARSSNKPNSAASSQAPAKKAPAKVLARQAPAKKAPASKPAAKPKAAPASNGKQADEFALDAVMTGREVAKKYDRKNKKVRKALKKGQVPARKSSKFWLLLRADAERVWGKKGDKKATIEPSARHDVLEAVTTYKEVASEYDLKEKKVIKAAKKGKLPARKAKKAWLMRREDVQGYWSKKAAKAAKK